MADKTWKITPRAAFVLGYLYHLALQHDRGIYLMKRTFNTGACELWGRVAESPTSYGTNHTIARVEPDELNACADACYHWLLMDNRPFSTTVAVYHVDFVRP